MPIPQDEYEALAEKIKGGNLVEYKGRTAITLDELDFAIAAADATEPAAPEAPAIAPSEPENPADTPEKTPEEIAADARKAFLHGKNTQLVKKLATEAGIEIPEDATRESLADAILAKQDSESAKDGE